MESVPARGMAALTEVMVALSEAETARRTQSSSRVQSGRAGGSLGPVVTKLRDMGPEVHGLQLTGLRNGPGSTGHTLFIFSPALHVYG